MTLEASARRYLEEVLGLHAAAPEAWERADTLPFFLTEAFEFLAVPLLGQVVVWAVDKSGDSLTPVEIRQRLARVEALTGERVVFVVAAMAAKERQRLIQARLPFLVPGNQLYLPDLGLDLREHFKLKPPPPSEVLNPATQALLIEALLRPSWMAEWQPALGTMHREYSAMTLSRAIKELSAAGLGSAFREGRSQALRFGGDAAWVWRMARPLLRSPVQRSHWVLPAVGHTHGGIAAGESALAAMSMLVEPPQPTFALSQADWKTAFEAGASMLDEPQEDAELWQRWLYPPRIDRNANSVDVLSLTLSLQNDSDERVQLALGELKERFPWSED